MDVHVDTLCAIYDVADFNQLWGLAQVCRQVALHARVVKSDMVAKWLERDAATVADQLFTCWRFPNRLHHGVTSMDGGINDAYIPISVGVHYNYGAPMTWYMNQPLIAAAGRFPLAEFPRVIFKRADMFMSIGYTKKSFRVVDVSMLFDTGPAARCTLRITTPDHDVSETMSIVPVPLERFWDGSRIDTGAVLAWHGENIQAIRAMLPELYDDTMAHEPDTSLLQSVHSMDPEGKYFPNILPAGYVPPQHWFE